jgi:hypothetical protein
MRRVAVFVLALCLVGVTAGFAGVTVDYDKKVDFLKLKTYAWKEGTPAGNPLNEERVHNAVNAALAEKGLQKVEGEADCYVYTHVKNKASQQVSIDHFGYGGYYGWGGWGGAYGSTSVNVQNVIDGMLIVDIVDGKTNQLAWRGLATKTLYPDTKPAKIEKIINKAVSQMFYGYPPKPEKK